MPATLAPYWRLFLAGIRQQSTYRLAMFGGLVANTTFGFLKVAMLLATVRAAGGEIQGYDIGEMSAYIWLSQGLLGSINLNGRTAFADRIKTGDIAIDFARPMNVQWGQVATEVGKSVYALLPRGLPSVAIGALVVGMTMPVTPLPYLLGVVSLLLGFVISATTAYALNTTGFWLVETRGVQVLYMVVSGFFAGLFVPISFFPGWLLAIAQATPFPSMMMFPIDIVSGRVTGSGAYALLGVQLLWLLVTAVLGHVLTLAGRRKVEIQGG
ncbi:ABC transporter permease [Metallococcus carri]|uniref:ABC transporter permease n=1 Tax=Metallococcus carri TaxID=1656884 RepID=UPI002E27E943|nr:ABC-2 family transporter protein [Metallococcus carri]